jgi:hypothetical protein
LSLVIMSFGSFVPSQKNKKKLYYNGYLYNKGKEDPSRAGVFRLQCERRYTHMCYVSITANTAGEILKEPSSEHKHEPDFESKSVSS